MELVFVGESMNGEGKKRSKNPLKCPSILRKHQNHAKKKTPPVQVLDGASRLTKNHSLMDYHFYIFMTFCPIHIKNIKSFCKTGKIDYFIIYT